MDLYISDMPSIVVFPRQLQHIGDAGENPLKWKSQYGSIVVTAFQTNAVSDGMNEKGLAAHLLYLHTTTYEKRDPKRPALSNLLWAQYFLDNFATVKDALAAANNFQIVSTKLHGRDWPIHLALEDATGDSAILEFDHGQMKVYHGPQYRVLTNEPAYDIQLTNLNRYKLFGGSLAMPGDVDPLSRFVRASSYLKTLPQPLNYIEAIAGTASVIRNVMVPFGAEDTSGAKTEDAWPTRWITLGDLTNKIFYFNSTISPNMLWLDFTGINLSAGAPVLALDLTHPELVGEVSKDLNPRK
jgi:penicillin V acylase-like amidase (Ntn superfamily)